MSASSFPFRRHALALALALATGNAHAATINVSDDCTLVNAINNANSDADTDGASGCSAGSEADVLELEANATYTLTTIDNSDELGANGLPSISSVVTINGNGSTVQRSSTTGTPEFRLLFVTASGEVSINQLQLTGGKVRYSPLPFRHISFGGGIYNQGKLSLTRTSVSNSSSYIGGGIANQGDLELTESTISGNSAPFGHEAGIRNQGIMVITNSSISNNRADGYAGGISNSGSMSLIASTVSGNSGIFSSGIMNFGDLTVINSTISNNSGNNFAGKESIGNFGSITLINSTVSNNTTVRGISNYSDIKLINSIVANNHVFPFGEECFSSGYNPNPIITLQGVNLISDDSCGAALIGDPKLGPLLDSGGFTLTHYFGKGSPAIDAVDNAFCTSTDQRGVLRPQPAGGNCDLGAVEHIVGTPDSVKDIVQFFNRKITKGDIVGIGTGQVAYAKAYALRRQLKTAGSYQEQNLTEQACGQLARTLIYIDTDNSPADNDYVTGSEATALADEITDLRTSWACF